jgi:para-nitrobenzyl esterase
MKNARTLLFAAGLTACLTACTSSASSESTPDSGTGGGSTPTDAASPGGAGGGEGPEGGSGASGGSPGGMAVPADVGVGGGGSGGGSGGAGGGSGGEPDAGPTPGCGTPLGPDPADPLRVGTTEGVIVGAAVGSVQSFLGVPFAAPPVGALRFRAPAAPACRADAISTTTFAPACLQVDTACATGQSADCTVEGDEDCLYLNVWRPARASADARPRPVLFFIHGGGNAIGSTGEEIAPGVRTYDGAALAELTDAVVVTTAYRVGPFGWAAHPDMALPENGGVEGNFGLLDQIEALRWVRANAAAFDLDPERVMIFGESAGAVNVCMLLASPHAAGLFAAALMQSGGCPAYETARVRATTADAAAALGCTDAPEGTVACLRAASGADLLLANPPNVNVAGISASTYQPHVDGDVLPEAPLAAFRAGRGQQVPTVVGSNADETAASIPPAASITGAAYEAAVRGLVGPLADAVLAQYPVDRFESPWEALMRVTTDAKFVCPTRTVLRALAAQTSDVPRWRYFYTHRLDNLVRREPYAQHGIELLFVFQRLNIGGYRPSADETALAAFMGRAWGALAGSGEPSVLDGPAWPPFDPTSDAHLVLEGGDLRAAEGVRTEDCDFWDALIPQP